MKCDKCGAPVIYGESHPIGLPPRYDTSENEKLREANAHYLEVCKENQKLQDELIETKREVEKLRAITSRYWSACRWPL